MDASPNADANWRLERWILDFAVLGAGSLVPAGLVLGLALPSAAPSFRPVASAGVVLAVTLAGATAGAVVGRVVHRVLLHAPDRHRTALAAALAPAVGLSGLLFVWPAALPALADGGDARMLLWLPLGWVSATLQALWFLPTYTALCRTGVSPWLLALLAPLTAPLVMAATTLAAVLLGLALGV